MTTYYVHPAFGNDTNAGISPEAAWKSLARVKGAVLRPGDTVLFSRDAVFDGGIVLSTSGAEGSPITFGAYGEGELPVFQNGKHGFEGKGFDHFVFENLAIKNMTNAAFATWESTNWTIRNCLIDTVATKHTDGAGATEGCGIQYWNGARLSVLDCTIRNVRADGIWVWDCDGLVIKNTRIEKAMGGSADSVQITKVRDFEIRGNYMSQVGSNSGKGILIVSYGERGVVANNTCIGGNFGFGGTFNDTVIENNHFVGQNALDWSTAIQIADWDGWEHVKNVTIRNNFFDESRTGIYMLNTNKQGHKNPIRENINIVNNVFKVREYAVRILSSIVGYSGSFVDNRIVGSSSKDWTLLQGKLLSGKKWDERGTTFHTSVPSWNPGTSQDPPPAEPPQTAKEISGTDAPEVLTGTDGADRLDAKGGDDTVAGGKGDDWLRGGAGRDVFVYKPGDGNDTINWLEAGDKIDLSAFGAKNWAELLTMCEVRTAPRPEGGTITSFAFRDADVLVVHAGSAVTADSVIFAESTPEPTPTPEEPPPSTGPSKEQLEAVYTGLSTDLASLRSMAADMGAMIANLTTALNSLKDVIDEAATDLTTFKRMIDDM